MATSDLDALFTATKRAFREVRRAAGHDLDKKKHFKEFIRERNAFHEALTSLNDELYRQKDALILPELLDEGDDSFLNASGNVSLRVTVAPHAGVPDEEIIGRLVDDIAEALEAANGRFDLVEVSMMPATD